MPYRDASAGEISLCPAGVAETMTATDGIGQHAIDCVCVIVGSANYEPQHSSKPRLARVCSLNWLRQEFTYLLGETYWPATPALAQPAAARHSSRRASPALEAPRLN
jgi:hypothetical protein